MAVSASRAVSAAASDTAASASYASNASTADSATSASYALHATSATSADTATSASYALSASWSVKSGTADQALTASYVLNAVSASWSAVAVTASYVDFSGVGNKPALVSSSLQFGPSDIFNVGTITASNIQVTNLSVINVTSSVVYSSGSNVLGSSLSNTQQLTGSVYITGSLTVNGSVNFGNNPINGTASYASMSLNAVSSSYVKGGVDATSLNLTTSGLTTRFFGTVVSGIVVQTVVDEFSDALGYAARWLVSARDGNNIRTGEVTATWNPANGAVEFSEVSTQDLGNTSALSFAVDNPSNNVRLVANPTAGNWEVRATRIVI